MAVSQARPWGAYVDPPLRGKVAFFQQLTGFSVSFAHADEKERERLNQLVASQNETA